MASGPLATIVGLDEFRRQLLRVDKDVFPRAFVDAGVEAANPVANAVRSALPHATGALAGTVRVAKIRTGAAIRVGTRAVPYIGPVEFGGWPSGRPFVRSGRYVYPTATPMTAKALDTYSAHVQKALDDYPWVQAR